MFVQEPEPLEDHIIEVKLEAEEPVVTFILEVEGSEHNESGVPALAVGGVSLNKILTVLEEDAHGELEIVHRNT